ncbi:MAG: WbqC family protein [Gammaproteobacteria bacterium]|nr:WbqC family protein [Gammaproteobacteria bacterium]
MSKAMISSTDWQKKLLDSLKCYKSTAPYYIETLSFIEFCIYDDSASVGDLNSNVLKKICAYLDIDTKIQQLSNMSLDLPDVAAPDEWACYISKAVGAGVYSNAPGGQHLFDADYYAKNNIILEFYRPVPLEYPTPGFSFEPGLSIIDSLMWVGCSALSDWCHDKPFAPVSSSRKILQSKG